MAQAGEMVSVAFAGIVTWVMMAQAELELVSGVAQNVVLAMGDAVKVLDKLSPFYGRIGVVAELTPGNSFVKLEFNPPNPQRYHLEPIALLAKVDKSQLAPGIGQQQTNSFPKNGDNTKLTPGQRIYIEGWIPCLLKCQTNNGNVLVELDRHIPDSTKDKVISWGAKNGAHNVEETRQLLASKSWNQKEFTLRDTRW